MNKNKLPHNIRSLVDNIEAELKDEFKKETKDFLYSVETIMEYYYQSLYKKVFHQETNDLNQYKEHLSNFLDKLTNALFTLDNYTYDDIIEQIIIDLIKTYWYITINFCKQNNIKKCFLLSNEDSTNEIKAISNLVDSIDIFEKLLENLDPLQQTLILIDKKKDLTIFGITFYQLPISLHGIIKKLIFQISIYQEYLTIKHISFVDDPSISIQEEQLNTIISLTNLKDIQYNIIYTLLKDKLLKEIDEEFWKDMFVKKISTKYIADECYQLESYIYHMRAEIDHQEYFMSSVIAYLLHPEELRIFDNIVYKHLKKLLDREVEI